MWMNFTNVHVVDTHYNTTVQEYKNNWSIYQDMHDISLLDNYKILLIS